MRRSFAAAQLQRTARRVRHPSTAVVLAQTEAAVHAQLLHHALQRVVRRQSSRVGVQAVAAQGAALGGFKALHGAGATERVAACQRHGVCEHHATNAALQSPCGRRHPHTIRLALAPPRHLRRGGASRSRAQQHGQHGRRRSEEGRRRLRLRTRGSRASSSTSFRRSSALR